MSEQKHKLVLMVLPVETDTRKLLERERQLHCELDQLPFAEVDVSLSAIRSDLPGFNFEVDTVAAGLRLLMHETPGES